MCKAGARARLSDGAGRRAKLKGSADIGVRLVNLGDTDNEVVFSKSEASGRVSDIPSGGRWNILSDLA